MAETRLRPRPRHRDRPGLRDHRRIGFEGRRDYGAIGTVTNLAARLCGEAQGGQILVSSRVAGTLEGQIDFEEVGRLTLTGFLKPVPTFNVIGPRFPSP